MFHRLVTSFAKPNFDLGNDNKIHEADRTVEELQERRRDLERRLRLLGIQGTPRGENG